jgi:hypothetical protein
MLSSRGKNSTWNGDSVPNIWITKPPCAVGCRLSNQWLAQPSERIAKDSTRRAFMSATDAQALGQLTISFNRVSRGEPFHYGKYQFHGLVVLHQLMTMRHQVTLISTISKKLTQSVGRTDRLSGSRRSSSPLIFDNLL